MVAWLRCSVLLLRQTLQAKLHLMVFEGMLVKGRQKFDAHKRTANLTWINPHSLRNHHKLHTYSIHVSARTNLHSRKHKFFICSCIWVYSVNIF